MDFILTEEQQAIQDMAEKFAKNELVPHIKEHEAKGEFTREFIQKIGKAGLYGALYPVEYGGSEAGMFAQTLIMEQIMRYSLEAGYTFNQLSVNVPMAIFNWGTEEQRQKYIPRFLKGELIGAFALTEPSSGSDAANMSTTARREGDYYILNGAKMWISLGSVADVLLLFAKTDKSARHKGISAFLLEANGLAGMDRRKMDIFTGTKCWPTGEMYFDECKIPAEWIIGKEGEGFKVAMNTLHYGRVAVPARAVGVCQACLDACKAYAQERTAFGRPIAEYQAIQHYVAEMVCRTEASRLFVYRAASMADHGMPFGRASSIAKYFAGEALKYVAMKGFEIFGAYSFSTEFPIYSYLMASHVLSVGEGAQNLQRDLIFKDELGWKKIDRHHIIPKFAEFTNRE